MRDRHMMNWRKYSQIGHFLRNESGTMAPLMLMIFFVMLLIGGMAVDMMRFEVKRVALQQTIDRAALAAASLTNTEPAAAVVTSYFTTSGVSGQLVSVTTPDNAANKRTVRATATVRSGNYFMAMMGVPHLDAINAAVATQSVTEIEIMLVLDISGSMGSMAGSKTKIAALRDAATTFVDLMIPPDTGTGSANRNKVSIGIVPYNHQVNAGADLRSVLNVAYDNGVPSSSCFEFTPAMYSRTDISPTEPLTNAVQGDTFTGNRRISSWFCPDRDGATITLPTTDAALLKRNIAKLTAGGNTSVAIGMRWGTALIDPAIRPAYASLITQGKMGTSLAGRPYDYSGDIDKLKIIVLMTDGTHVSHNRVTDPYKVGESPIFYNAGNDSYSVYVDRPSTTSDYYIQRTGGWGTSPDGAASVRLAWNQVWQSAGASWVVNNLITASGLASASAVFSSYASAATMDTYLTNNCAAARNHQVRIYTIPFAAPAGGQAVLFNCASSPKATYYLQANDDAAITTAFRMIAADLQALRLSQ